VSERVEVHVERSPSHCPYCKAELVDLAGIVACAACGARHHRECHSENHARCATCGSAAVLAPVLATLQVRPPVPRAAVQPGGDLGFMDRLGFAMAVVFLVVFSAIVTAFAAFISFGR